MQMATGRSVALYKNTSGKHSQVICSQLHGHRYVRTTLLFKKILTPVKERVIVRRYVIGRILNRGLEIVKNTSNYCALPRGQSEERGQFLADVRGVS